MVKKLFLSVLAVLILFPFIYCLNLSFFTAKDFFANPVNIFPSSFSFDNYVKVLSHQYFTQYFVNSLFTSIAAVFFRILVAVLSSYAFSFYKFKYSKVIFYFILSSVLVPSDLLLLQNYITVEKLNLLDSYMGIIITSVLSQSVILMLYHYFTSIPFSIYESARLDGANDRTFIYYILLPLSKAVITIMALHSFIGVFNSYLWPLLVTNKTSMRTIQVGLTMLGYLESLNYGPLFGGIILICLPFVVFFIIFKTKIIEYISKGNLYRG